MNAVAKENRVILNEILKKNFNKTISKATGQEIYQSLKHLLEQLKKNEKFDYDKDFKVVFAAEIAKANTYAQKQNQEADAKAADKSETPEKDAEQADKPKKGKGKGGKKGADKRASEAPENGADDQTPVEAPEINAEDEKTFMDKLEKAFEQGYKVAWKRTGEEVTFKEFIPSVKVEGVTVAVMERPDGKLAKSRLYCMSKYFELVK